MKLMIMKSLLMGAVLILCPAVAAAQISVTIQRPLAGGLVDDNLVVIATVTSANAIQDLTATALGRTGSMGYDLCALRSSSQTCIPGWVGGIHAAGFPRGDVLITVTARDVSGNVAVDQRHVIFGRRPTLTVISPLQNAVARPLIHVVASCLDDDPAGCATMSVSDCPTPGVNNPLTFAGSFVDVFVRPCGSPLNNMNVVVSGTDYAGQGTAIDFEGISRETSPTLRSMTMVDGRIVDARDTRVLYRHLNTFNRTELWVHDFVAGGADTRIPAPVGYSEPFIGQEFLTPHGALFLARNTTASATTVAVFEWRDGTLVDLGPFGGWLDHSDNYAAWSDDALQHIVLRDLQAGTTGGTTVPARLASSELGVADNGDVVFTMQAGTMGPDNVWRYRGGTTTQIDGGGLSSQYSSPRTDGINVSYLRSLAGSSDTMLFDGTEHVLAPGGAWPAMVNNGWAAYSGLVTGRYQVFERAPDGSTTQLTFFTTSSTPRSIAANGQVVISTADNAGGTEGLYLAVPGMALRRVADSMGPAFPNIQPYYLNGQWYFALGNTLFDVLDTCALTVSPAFRSYGAGGGTGTFDVWANGDGCAWSVSGVPSWITVYYGASGSGAGTVRLGVTPNSGAARSATLTIAGHTVPINQSAAGTLTHTRSDFTGDGRADRAMFRPYGGTWLIEGLLPIVWGEPWSTPAPADYDGDGITDLGAFAAESGTWSVRGQSVGEWGSPGDIPVPSDYDADGRADLAVYRPSTGMWFVRGVGSAAWGSPGDIPLPADYDGDGRADLAVYSPSTGMWFVRGVGSAAWGLAGDIPVPADYNGDGIADIAVYRPSTGVWYVKDQFVRAYGLTGDLPVPLDYNGDGQAELAVFRRSTGTWYVEGGGPGMIVGRPGDLPIGLPAWLIPRPSLDLDGDRRTDAVMYEASNDQWLGWHSINGFFSRDGFSFGLPSDVRLIADFDGDGRGDLGLMRPSTGMWYIDLSTAGYNTYATYGPWGASGDAVLPGDYDGDRRSDLMVFRASEGRWYLKTSSTGYVSSATLDWGLAGDIGAPADYDGDRRLDVAVFRPSTGRWYVKRSSDGSMLTIDWGASGDVPVPADYDGDGRTDAAIFRPSTGAWWIRYSSTGFTTSATIVYGASGDVPIPGDYNGDGVAEPAYFRPDVGFFVFGIGQIYTAASGDQAIRDR